MYKIERVNYSGGVFSYDTIYDQSTMNTRSAIGPKCNLEVNEPGSLQFTLYPGHPMLGEIGPLETYVRALDDGEEIFYGRIIHQSDPTTKGLVTFQCEGALSFLLDSEIAPYGKDANGNQVTKKLKAKKFFQDCITEHNAEVDDPRRQFSIGAVTIDDADDEVEYSITSYTQTKSAIESNLLEVYGGYLRIGAYQSGAHYIQWIKAYDRLDPQEIQIGTNVVDQTNQIDGANLFTVLRPIGKDGITLATATDTIQDGGGNGVTNYDPEIGPGHYHIPVGGTTIDIYPQATMAKFGRILKTVQFNDATTRTELINKAIDYIDRIDPTIFVSSNIQMVDMHYLDGTVPKVRLGDRFSHIHGIETIMVTAASMEINFEDPKSNTVELKNDKSLEPSDGSKHKDRKLTKSSSRSSKQAKQQYFKTLKETGEHLDILAQTVTMQGETLAQHYDTITTTMAHYRRIASRVDSAEGIILDQKIKMNDVEYKVKTIEGTAVIQNSQFISTIAGKFEIWTDPVTGVETVHLKDGAELAVDDANGTTITVGQRLAQVGTDVDGMASIVDSMQGSALWTQRDLITGVCGEYDVVTTTIPDPDHPGQFLTIKKLVIKSGGGMMIRKDGVEYGVYMTAEGGDTVLRGGLMVDMINGQATTKIRGDRVDIDASQITLRAGETLDTVVGHWTEKSRWDVDENGNRVKVTWLEYEADAGMVIKRLDNDGVMTQYGVFDEGNLTGGVMVKMINGNQVETHIIGDRILIGNDLSSGNLPDWAEEAEGLIAGKATIGQLNAVKARITTIESDYITTSNLKSSISNLDLVNVKAITATADASGTAYASLHEFRGSHFKVATGAAGGNATYRDLVDGVYELRIVPPSTQGVTGANEYKLQKKAIGDINWSDVGSFSRATTLSGAWDGGDFNITASPQGDVYTLHFPKTQPANLTNTLYISTSETTSDSSKSISYMLFNTTGDKDKVDLQYYDGSEYHTVAQIAHNRYTQAWTNATNSDVLSVPSATASGQSITIKWPSVIVDGSSNSRDYTLVNDGNNKVILRYWSGSSYITVAEYAHNKYNAGWGAAHAAVKVPNATASGQSIRVEWPNSTVGGDPETRDYTIVNDGNNKVILRYWSGSSYITVAEYAHNKYNAGWDYCANNKITVIIPASQTLSNGATVSVSAAVTTSDGVAHSLGSATYTGGSGGYNEGWDYCANNKITVVFPASGSIGYSGSVTVSAAVTKSDGQSYSLGSATYTSPADRYNTGYDTAVNTFDKSFNANTTKSDYDSMSGHTALDFTSNHDSGEYRYISFTAYYTGRDNLTHFILKRGIRIHVNVPQTVSQTVSCSHHKVSDVKFSCTAVSVGTGSNVKYTLVATIPDGGSSWIENGKSYTLYV